MGARPTGTVTFLFTDVEGSTRLWAADRDAMAASLIVHDAVVRAAIEVSGGYVFATAGDSFGAAFGRASDAVRAATDAQAALATAAWPGPALRVRMGLHLGEADERDADYFGPAVNTTARVEAAGHGGQILLTDAVRVTAGVVARDLGVYRLRDVPEPMRLFQLGHGDFPPLRVNEPTRTNLPSRATRLIGRDADVSRVGALLQAHRLVTLTGVGGSGKTRLAVAVGESEVRRREGGVWFVDLTASSSSEDLPVAIASSLDLQLGAADPIARIVGYLAETDALVVLDNCEHLVDACAAFAEEFLAAPGAARLLATSREALDVDGEQVVQVSSLASETPDGTPGPAVELFVERARAIDSGFVVEGDTLATLAALCARLDGMPLAIELAAARVPVMSPAELLDGLNDRFNLLSGGRRRQRQRTLEATLDWSYGLLDDEQRRALRAFGVFIGGFDIDAAAGILDVERRTALALVEALVAKSLVVRTTSAGASRFGLLETVKAYAEDRLVQADEASAVRDRHAAHFHAVSQRRGRAVAFDVRDTERLGPDRANVSTAIVWSLTRGHPVRAGELLLGGIAAYNSAAHAKEARTLYLRCIDVVAAADPELAGQLGLALVNPLIVLTDWPMVAAVMDNARGSAYPDHRAMACAQLAFMSSRTHVQRATSLLAEAAEHLALAERERPGLNTDLAWAFAEVMDGVLAYFRGEYDRVVTVWDRVESRMAGHDFYDIGRVGQRIDSVVALALLGRVPEALALWDELRRFSWGYGDRREHRAIVLLVAGDIEAAEVEIRRHAREAVSGRLPRQCNDTVLLFAALAHARGEDDIARELLPQMGAGRSPSTIVFSRRLAQELGIADRFNHAERAYRDASDRAHLTAPMDALRHELHRRGWD